MKQYLRIIPTRVGTRIVNLYQNYAAKDHPHACGDKDSNEVAAYKKAGSSPRVWGQGKSREINAGNSGIIPTRVGTSIISNFCKTLIEDHPHACGDKQQLC